MKSVAETLGVARSNLIDRMKCRTKPRRRYQEAQDAAVAPLFTALVSARSTYGYRRITAILNRQLRSEGLAPVNHKRVYRIMQADLDGWIKTYNEERPHQGRWCFGKTPMRTFLDARSLAEEKMIAA